jgi:hypothetical protein
MEHIFLEVCKAFMHDVLGPVLLLWFESRMNAKKPQRKRKTRKKPTQ